jgi:hypothetical protein
MIKKELNMNYESITQEIKNRPKYFVNDSLLKTTLSILLDVVVFVLIMMGTITLLHKGLMGDSSGMIAMKMIWGLLVLYVVFDLYNSHVEKTKVIESD